MIIKDNNRLKHGLDIEDFVLTSNNSAKTPYLTIVLTSKCTFKCIYCGDGGENTDTCDEKGDFIYDSFMRIIDIAEEKGITKIRLTGGEPFLYPQIIDCIKYIIAKKVSLLINSNGVINQRILDTVKHFSSEYFSIAISLDAIDENTHNLVTGTKNTFQKILNTITTLQNCNLLYKINTVITKHNIDTLDDIINFCKQKQINLTLLESIPTPSSFSEWNIIHSDIAKIDSQLEKEATKIYAHDYTNSFGIPVKIYKIDSISISVKLLNRGTHYNSKFCNLCDKFPCHEGMYHLKVLPSMKFSPCRWQYLKNSTNVKEDFNNALKLFKGLRFIPYSDKKKKLIVQ